MYQHSKIMFPFDMWDDAIYEWIKTSFRKALEKKKQANILLYSQTSLHTTQTQCLYWWSQNLRSRIHPSDTGDSHGGSRGASCSASFSRYGKVCTAKVSWKIIFPAASLRMSRMNPFLATEDRPASTRLYLDLCVWHLYCLYSNLSLYQDYPNYGVHTIEQLRLEAPGWGVSGPTLLPAGSMPQIQQVAWGCVQASWGSVQEWGSPTAQCPIPGTHLPSTPSSLWMPPFNWEPQTGCRIQNWSAQCHIWDESSPWTCWLRSGRCHPGCSRSSSLQRCTVDWFMVHPSFLSTPSSFWTNTLFHLPKQWCNCES